MDTVTSRRSVLLAAILGLACLASACGSGAPDTAEARTATAAANEAQDQLVANDDVRLTELLDVRTGKVATLKSSVDGDRPILLWFYAPH